MYASQGFVGGTPYTTYMDWIKAQIDGHADWEFVETVTSGSFRHDIFRCHNPLYGSPWYFGISGTSGVLLNAWMAESYNPATDTVSRAAPTGTQAPDPAADYTYTADHVLGAAAPANIYKAANMVNTSSASTLYLAITREALILVSSNTGWFFAGTPATRFDPVNDPFPLAAFTTTGSAVGRITREPLYTPTSNAFVAVLATWLEVPSAKDQIVNAYYASPWVVHSRGGITGGAMRGRFSTDWLYLPGSSFGFDRIQIDGAWYRHLNANLWHREAAA